MAIQTTTVGTGLLVRVAFPPKYSIFTGKDMDQREEITIEGVQFQGKKSESSVWISQNEGRDCRIFTLHCRASRGAYKGASKTPNNP